MKKKQVEETQMLNGNIKMYNEIAQQKIKGRRELKSSMKLTR